ncbi:MAG: TonB-dependent receptor [Pedobacter sp.]
MQINERRKDYAKKKKSYQKLFMVMKVTILFIVAFCIQVSGSALAQRITLHQKNKSLSEVLVIIKAQSGSTFFYDNLILKTSRPVDIDVENVTLDKALSLVFKNQPLTYSIIDNIVVISLKREVRARLNVEGQVMDENGGPVRGASVKVKGSTLSTMTDTNGKFILEYGPEDAVLVVSYIGYQTQEIKMNGRTKITISLKEASKELEEVIVTVGYGVQKKANLTGAVATVNFKDIENVPQSNTVNILAGRLPGVSVIQGGAQPGYDQADVNIRGLGTLNDATPLVIIDGVQATLNDMGNLSPQEISNVTVLKDASSAAIYGSRGANGVILVTTKMPTKEGVNINFSANASLQQALHLPDLVEAWQYMEFQNGASASKRYSPAVIDSAKNGLISDNIANTRWHDIIFRTAPMQNYNLSFNGKSKNTTYELSGGILEQTGILKGTDGNRYTLRTNIQSQVKDGIKIGLNLWGFSRNASQPFRGMRALLRDALRVPNMPVTYLNGEYAVYNAYVTGNKLVQNPLLNTMIGYVKLNEMKLNAQPSLEVKLAKGLSARSAFTYSYGNTKNDSFNPTYSYNNPFGQPSFVNEVSNLSNQVANNIQTQWQSTLSYSGQLQGKHSLSALLGHEILSYKQTLIRATGQKLPSNDLQQLDNASANFSVGGNQQDWSLQSLFGRVNYDYEDKYLFEANFRADGSSRFNGEYRYSPSASLGWLISKEPFFKPIEPVVSFLKVRAGIGRLGNDRIGNYTYQQSINLSQYYTIGGSLQTAGSITNLGNPQITWEQTTTTNVGLDLGLFKNRLFVNVDAYNRITDGILFQLPLPQSFGSVTSAYQNIGKVSNKGVELNMEFHDQVGKLNYRLAGNFAYNKNNVEKLNGQRVINGDPTSNALTIIQEGASINSWFGYVVDGLYTQQDMDNKYPRFTSDVIVGSLKFKDLNNDGVINGDDRAIIGQATTPYTFGFSGGADLKGFDFTFLLQGVAGKEIYTYDYGNIPGAGAQNNFWRDWWERSYNAERNPNGDWPIVKTAGAEAIISSSFWLDNSSYLRVKNMELGYTLPAGLLKKAKISRMRVYVAAQNLFTITNTNRNVDPERANFQISNSSYPQTKIFSAGINTTF